MRGLRGKHVLITGAAGGIGQALCQRFAEEGAVVLATDLQEGRLATLRAGLVAAGHACEANVLDITDYAAVAAAVATLIQQHGRIDVLVNNAGWDLPALFLDTTPDFWQKVIAINLHGPLNLQHCVVKHMVGAGGGKVVNIASDAGRVGSSGEAVYSACKGGIIAFTKTLAREVARANVRVNCVCPGPTDTPLLEAVAGTGDYGKKLLEGLKRAIPLKRLGRPEDLAGMVAFLASEDADFITGQTVSVSGGLTMN